VTASALLIGGFTTLSSSPASAAGSTANTISASSAPSAGSARGTYTPTATATSGDKVVITLEGTSTGCSLSSGKVTFTGAGTCVVDFNDAGNVTYAAAAQVRQSIKVYAANVITPSKPPVAGSTGGVYYPGAVATSGDGVVKTLASSSTGCSLSSGKVTFTGAGTCEVNFNDVGNGAFAPAAQVRQNIKVYTANVIDASTPPGAGAIHGTYAASATVTSGDTVVITLDGTSTGCSIDKGVVTFTANGVCKVNFNDVGNGAFAAAHQVQQVITVGAGNPNTQATLTLTSRSFLNGRSMTLTSAGGSGSGAVSYAVTNSGSAGCFIDGRVLKSNGSGWCTVTVTKAGDASYASARSLATTVRVVPIRPRALRMSSAVWTGRTVSTQIVGTQFYGFPRVISSASGTRVSVLRDNGRVLTIRVRVKAHTTRGVHTFTLVFAHGQRTSIRYVQR
jgi:Fe-S cluster biogenesis protein NfuA